MVSDNCTSEGYSHWQIVLLGNYSSRPQCGHRPLVLVVFDDFPAEGNFLGVARKEMERAGVTPPLWVSQTGLLEKEGPLGQAWRSPDVLEPSYAFR